MAHANSNNQKGNRRAYHPDRTARRQSATVRQEFRATLSDQEQLNRLVARGHGHCKEAERLRAKLLKAA